MKSLLLLAGAVSTLALYGQVQTFSTSAGPLTITPVLHASFYLEAGGKVICVDPAPPAKFDRFPKADLVLITDIHSDHMDPASVAAVSKADTVVWAPAAVAKTVTAAAVIANGDTKTWGAFTVEAVPMYNEKRGPSPGKLYHDKGRGNGYIVTYGGKRIYISGDTEGTPEMRSLKNIDVALVCMNLPFTMPPDEAAEAVKAFHPAIVLPYHYRGSNLAVFEQGLADSGIEVRKLDWYPKS